jgi:hypothetical protein
MATLTIDTPRTYELGDHNDIPVIASEIIYEGAAVGIVVGTGHARPLVAGDLFVGFATTKADNSTGAAAAINVRVKRYGEIVLPVTNVAITDIGKPVYAADDNDFVLTATGNTQIGRVKRFVSAGYAVVAFDADGGGVGATLTALTDNSGGTANTTLEDCNDAVTGVDGVGSNAASKADVDARLVSIANNFADLAAKVNEIIAVLK